MMRCIRISHLVADKLEKNIKQKIISKNKDQKIEISYKLIRKKFYFEKPKKWNQTILQIQKDRRS